MFITINTDIHSVQIVACRFHKRLGLFQGAEAGENIDWDHEPGLKASKIFQSVDGENSR